MKVGVAALAAFALAVGAAPRARAEDAAKGFRAIIDNVELEPGALTGSRLRIHLSALSLDGHLLDLGEQKSLRLFVGGSEQKSQPYALGTYGATTHETAIVIVVETTQAYADALPTILDALDGALLGELKDSTTQVAVMGYGDATGSGKLGTVRAAHGKLAGLANDGSVGDPALVDTVERALTVLKRAHPLAPAATDATDDSAPAFEKPLRKLILIVGDGRDRGGDRDRVTRIGKRAAKEGVRIHALGFAPTDIRKPLLTLGELSRQSLGTFRWVRSGKADSWKPVVQQVADEITKQNVVTYFFTADEDPSGKKLKIVTAGRTEIESNEVKIPQLACAGAPCDGYCADDHCVQPRGARGRGVLGWVLLVGGIAVGAIVVLGVIGYAMSKRTPAVQLPPGVAPPPGAVPAPAPKKAKKPKADPAAALAAMQAAHHAPRPGPVLFVLNGPRAGERIALKNGFTIGKVPGMDLVIDDGFTSSRHAVIMMDGNLQCRLLDQGSTNGTLVNGARVTDIALAPGQIIQIGSTQLRYLAE